MNLYKYNNYYRSNLLSGHGEGGVEPLLKRVAALEDGGKEKVEQSPQLRETVLQGEEWSG